MAGDDIGPQASYLKKIEFFEKLTYMCLGNYSHVYFLLALNNVLK